MVIQFYSVFTRFDRTTLFVFSTTKEYICQYYKQGLIIILKQTIFNEFGINILIQSSSYTIGQSIAIFLEIVQS